MSERQAKKLRKEQPAQMTGKTGNKARVLTNLLITVVILAVLVLGIYAVRDILKGAPPAQEGEQTQTVAEVAESEGITVEELLAKCDLQDAGLTGESLSSDMFALLTVEKFAKYEETTTEELKEEYGITGVSDDTLWQEAQMKMPMSKLAEKQFGMSFEEFKKAQGLPDEITADLTQEQAIAIMQTLMQTK